MWKRKSTVVVTQRDTKHKFEAALLRLLVWGRRVEMFLFLGVTFGVAGTEKK